MCFDYKYAFFWVQENESLETETFQATEACRSALFHGITTEQSLDGLCAGVRGCGEAAAFFRAASESRAPEGHHAELQASAIMISSGVDVFLLLSSYQG